MKIACEFDSRLPHHLLEKWINKSVLKNECFIFLGATRGFYPCFKYKGKTYNIHRFIGSKIFNFDITNIKIEVCHTCNNKKCWNPNHLYKGDKCLNMQDAVKEGTHNLLKENR